MPIYLSTSSFNRMDQLSKDLDAHPTVVEFHYFNHLNNGYVAGDDLSSRDYQVLYSMINKDPTGFAVHAWLAAQFLVRRAVVDDQKTQEMYKSFEELNAKLKLLKL